MKNYKIKLINTHGLTISKPNDTKIMIKRTITTKDEVIAPLTKHSICQQRNTTTNLILNDPMHNLQMRDQI